VTREASLYWECCACVPSRYYVSLVQKMKSLLCGYFFLCFAASAVSSSSTNSLANEFDPTIPIDYFPSKPEGFILGNDSTARDEDDYSTKRQVSITYHGGSLMRGTSKTYVIWYGNWADSAVNQQIRYILTYFLANLGSSYWLQINTAYIPNAGGSILNTTFVADIGYGVSTYTYGSVLKSQHIFDIVRDSLASNRLPTDPNGIYFVFTSPDIQQYDDPSYGFCTNSGGKYGYCGWHSNGRINGNTIKYAFVGTPSNCMYCEAQRISPNGNWVADSMASIVAHELAEVITDPEFNGWFDANSEENADKCAWQFGQTAIAGGYQYNVQF